MQFNQFLGNRQTQSCPAIAARNGIVRLGELFKNAADPIPRNTSASVNHVKFHIPFGCVRAFECRYLNFNGTLFRELDGIADQIIDDLPQT